eukprot:Pgem_evm1s5297
MIKSVPHYMVPAEFNFLENLPLTPNVRKNNSKIKNNEFNQLSSASSINIMHSSEEDESLTYENLGN